MQIEDAFLKYIKIKNSCHTLKELYLVVQVDQNRWIGKVQPLAFGDTASFQ